MYSYADNNTNVRNKCVFKMKRVNSVWYVLHSHATFAARFHHCTLGLYASINHTCERLMHCGRICLVYFDWRTLLAVSSIPVGITMIAFPWVGQGKEVQRTKEEERG